MDVHSRQVNKGSDPRYTPRIPGRIRRNWVWIAGAIIGGIPLVVLVPPLPVLLIPLLTLVGALLWKKPTHRMNASICLAVAIGLAVPTCGYFALAVAAAH